MGTCGQPGYVFRDFCLEQGIEFIIFCLNQGIDLSICVLNWVPKPNGKLRICLDPKELNKGKKGALPPSYHRGCGHAPSWGKDLH